MANRRMLSRRISQSKKVNQLSLKSQIVWTWTFPYLDDYGCYTADSEDIKTEVLPKNKKITIKNIETALVEISKAGLISLYKDNNKLYQQYTKFNDFQTFRADRERRRECPKSNGIPMTTTDTPKLSKVKLSKVKLSKVNIKKHKPSAASVDNSKQPFPAPTQAQKQELALIHKELNDNLKFNIFTFIERVKRLKGYYPPIDLMIKGGKALHKSKAENPWGYLSEVLKKELPNYFAELNIKEHDKFKEEKSTLSFKDILEGGKGKI